MRNALIVFAIALTMFACKDDKKDESTGTENNSNAVKPPATMNYSVLKIYPHDTASFTEGLFLLNGHFYESTGLPGKSFLLRVDPPTGKILQKFKLDDPYFGEGISMINNKIYMLTYQEHKVFVFDMKFKKIGEFSWPYEGWGMTTDGKSLILDTGGSNIYFVNPETFKIERTLGVTDNNGYVDSINELEYVNGYLYANRWLKNVILKINAQTGAVEARADLTDIFPKNGLPPITNPDHCLNGIAYDSAKGSFYITGKNWPNLFEVKFN